METEEETILFSKIKELLTEFNISQVQKDSFNFFINHRLQKIIQEESNIVIPLTSSSQYIVQFGQVFVDKPYIIDENRHLRYITPNEARIRDLSYSSVISINIKTMILTKHEHQEPVESDHKEYFKIPLARIPMMIGSSKCNLYNKNQSQRFVQKECMYDQGGYFIIKGKERVIVAQERINYNIVYVFEQKLSSKYKYIAEIRSMSEETGHSVLVQIKLSNSIDKTVYLQLPYISQDIPLSYILMAYGFHHTEIQWILQFSLRSIQSSPIIENLLDKMLHECDMIQSAENAIAYISQFAVHLIQKDRKSNYVLQILNNELFPHLGIMSTKYHKVFFLGHMLRKLLMTFIGKRSFDDRDHINNKRLELSGHLLSELFRTLFKRFVRTTEAQLLKRSDILVVLSRNNSITQGIKHCFSTGNWGIPKSNYIRTGVSQILSRLTYNSFLSHLGRVLIPIGKEGKNTKIRQLHPSQIGFFCPFETPEGHCLTAETPILLGDGISQISIEKIQAHHLVTTVNPISGNYCPSTIHHYFQVIPSELYHLEIYGRVIRASGFHPFLVLTPSHDIRWKYAKDICPEEDRIACVPHLSLYPLGHISNPRARLLGVLRACQDQHSMHTFILPIHLDWNRVVKDLKTEWTSCQYHRSTRQIIFMDPYPFDPLELLFPLESNDRYDFLIGWFSVYPPLMDRKTSSFHPFPWSSEESYQIQQYCKTQWNVRIDRVTIPNDQEAKLSYLLFPNQSMTFQKLVDLFGCYYSWHVWKQLFLRRDYIVYLQSDTSPPISFEQFEQTVFYWNDHWIFYPLTIYRRETYVEMTMDFTTTHSNHTFIANGFITHNSAGVVKNLALTTQVSTKLCPSFIRLILEEFPEIIRTFPMQEETFSDLTYYKIFLDGNWIGFCYSRSIYDRLIEYKRSHRFSFLVSISINDLEHEILIFCDEGRTLRPLWNASNMPSLDTLRSLSIHELIQQNYIELKDSYEIENSIIAMHYQEVTPNSPFHYCEIHPCLLTGLCVALIPYSDHTQAPRITYHASMGKQAIGYFSTTCHERIDTISHVLQHPEKPLLQTHIGEFTHCNELASGSNLIVAVAMYTGFNQEDSVIFNQSAIDRGLFRSFCFRTMHIEERKHSTSQTETICLPPKHLQILSYNYHKLGEDGIVQCGIYVGPSDVIVGRIQTITSKSENDEIIDTSVVIKSGEEGYIDRIYITTSPEGYKIIRIKLRSLKIPEIGDKVESREAQKGIVGMIYRQEDMPFCCQSGIIPDIIINPLCLPSRMTINQIIECIAAKSSAQDGKKRYCTPFSSHSTKVVDSLIETLHQNGFRRDGKERMYNGFTGQSFQADIFIGPTYYHRLKHLVSSKIHARNHGSLQVLTRQPVEGRSRDGGLRFGEMERDCMISQGVSRFLTERLFDMSDIYHFPICPSCGTIPHSNHQCHLCNSNQIQSVLLPYACKLLFQELMAMNIKIKLFPDN